MVKIAKVKVLVLTKRKQKYNVSYRQGEDRPGAVHKGNLEICLLPVIGVSQHFFLEIKGMAPVLALTKTEKVSLSIDCGWKVNATTLIFFFKKKQWQKLYHSIKTKKIMYKKHYYTAWAFVGYSVFLSSLLFSFFSYLRVLPYFKKKILTFFLFKCATV